MSLANACKRYLLVICSEYTTLDPVLNSAVHPHQSFLNVSKSTSVFTAGELATLEAFQPVTDDFKQISVKYTTDTARSIAWTVLKSYLNRLVIAHDNVFMISIAHSCFINSVDSVEILTLLSCT